jgi:hypothetical protein
MYGHFDKLTLDLASYRTIMDRAFSRTLSRPRDCRKYFLELLVSTSQLYLDYVAMLANLSKLEKLSSTAFRAEPIESNINRDNLLRQRFRKRVESLPCWPLFEPENAFSKFTGLRTLKDYFDSFSLHLPEIYEETFRAEGYARIFRKRQSASALTGLVVSLQHMGRHHISYARFALEWAADECSWGESEQ